MNANHSSHVRVTHRGWAVFTILWVAVAYGIDRAVLWLWSL